MTCARARAHEFPAFALHRDEPAGSTSRLSPVPVRPGSALVPEGSFFQGKDAAPLSIGPTSFCNTERLNMVMTARSKARATSTARSKSGCTNRPGSPTGGGHVSPALSPGFRLGAPPTLRPPAGEILFVVGALVLV